jgi:type I restriction enzyme R subunit
MVMHQPNESQTRTSLIDKQLAQAGWSSNRRTLIEEYALYSKEVDPPYGSEQFADYVLLNSHNEPLAIVEAKSTSRDALAGKRQAADYASLIEDRFGYDPFIFLTNGNEIHFWDRKNYPPRKISGFYTRDDLERLLHQRNYGQPLADIPINASIAGRDYQNEAIRRVTEGIQQARRSFLLVMATGTGKTRTTIALIDLLLRAKRVQRILFLADRRELVRQAMSEFKTHLPNESLARIESGQTSGARIQFATYPSMMQVFSRLSVGYYDFIVADESHRSIYQRYKAIFDHFDAIRLGLTATPTDYIDHNTFGLFECEDGVPSYHYGYRQAVTDQHLVNYRVLDAQTTFQIKGIQGDALPEQLQQMAIDQGVPIEELNFEGSEIEKNVINQGTNDAIVREFMDQCRKDTLGLPHKSIFFAMSHAHAKRLYQSFNRLYPEWQQQGLAEIIDSHMERADAVLDDFKYKNMPRVAISVDMLDTGIDVPAIQNLILAKPVYSQVKFWQMIGRGTRLWDDHHTGEIKKDFLIIDHWKNFAYFKLNPEGEIAQSNEPLPVRLFRLRLEKWQLLVAQNTAAEEVIADLQQMLAALPQQSINVRPHWDEIHAYLTQWPPPGPSVIQHLSNTIAPLLRLVSGTGLDELQFIIWCEQLAIAWLKGDVVQQDRSREKIQDAVSRLADNVPEVRRMKDQRAWVMTPGFWDHLDLPRINQLRMDFAPLMRYRTTTPKQIVEINLPDRISQRSWIIYGPTGEGAFAETYREQVEAMVKRLADELPALSKIKQGETVSPEELATIADTLNQADLFVTEETLRKAYDNPNARLTDFLTVILEENGRLDDREGRINKAFEEFITQHGFLRANQLNFLRAIKAIVIRHARITRATLSHPPLSQIGKVEILFPENEIDEIVRFANQLMEDIA